MFDRIKALFSRDEPEDNTPIESLTETNKTPSKGIQRNSIISVTNDRAELFESDMNFKMGNKEKSVVGISRYSEEGESRLRAYTNDDYFLEINFFGDDKAGTESTCVLFQLNPNHGHDFLDDEGMEKWRNIIEESTSIEIDGHTYTRTDLTVHGGLEIVEVSENDIKPLDQTYAVFSRKIGATMEEQLIVNAEASVVLDEDTGEIVEYNDVGLWIATGIQIDSSEIKAYTK